MRDLIVTEFVSLDGVMEAPGGEPGFAHTGWVGDYMNEELGEFKLQETLDAESLLLGRVTYEGFAGAWPQRDGPFAEKMNAMPKHVVTTTSSELEWDNSTAIGADVAAEVRKLKAQDGGPVLVAGSRTLVHFLLANGLIDELRLMVFPVILGSGFRVFPDTPEKTPLKLAESKTFAGGVQVNSFSRA